MDAPECVLQELRDHFTFKVPGAEYSLAFKNKWWDGKKHLFDTRKRLLLAGLRAQVAAFCDDHGYEFAVQLDQSQYPFPPKACELPRLKRPFQYRDYQEETINMGLRNRRNLFVSPTSSGKSLIIYGLGMALGLKTLVLVTRKQLVDQMMGDFIDYGGSTDDVHILPGNPAKWSKKPMTLSTWQSVLNMDQEWFDQWECVLGDEAHGYKAKSLEAIMCRLVNAHYRFGFTGTLDGTKTHEMVLQGLFGLIHKVTTTRELMDREIVSNLKITAIRLKHPPDACKMIGGAEYKDEVDFLVSLPARNKFIRNLACSLTGNTMILYRFVAKQGVPLYNLIQEECWKTGRKVYLVHGGVETDEREQIRKIVETEDNAIIVASVGTFSEGTNIKRLHNIMLVSPVKSATQVPQSIGRGLRIGDGKEGCHLYDIADDLGMSKKRGKSTPNYALRHFFQRVEMYKTILGREFKENFKVHEVPIDYRISISKREMENQE